MVKSKAVCGASVTNWLKSHRMTEGLDFIWDGTLKTNLEIPKDNI